MATAGHTLEKILCPRDTFVRHVHPSQRTASSLGRPQDSKSHYRTSWLADYYLFAEKILNCLETFSLDLAILRYPFAAFELCSGGIRYVTFENLPLANRYG